MSLAAATATERLPDGDWSTPIQSGWDIRGNANGGYLLALAGRAMLAHSGRAAPVSLTAHYLSPGKAGPAFVRASTVKAGRQLTTVRAELVAGSPGDGAGRTVLALLGAFGELDSAADDQPRWIDAEPPALPPLAECLASADQADPIEVGLRRRVQVALHPDDAGFYTGEPSGTAQIRGWFNLRDDEPIDPVALLLAADAFPPTAFNARMPRGWSPTVELTVHIRARPAPGWLRARFTSRYIRDGMLEEDGELWDSADRLVAQSRQLALVARPESP